MNNQQSLWDDLHELTAGLTHTSAAHPTGVSDITPNWERLARKSDPFTSKLAAKKTVLRLSHTKQQVLDCLKLHPEGLIDEEIARYTGLKESSASKRRGDLVETGHVQYAGRVRNTSTGSPAKVWVVK